MPALFDGPIHHHSAENQKHSASPDESGSDEEIMTTSHLKPSRFRKRDVCGQEHQGEQRRDNHIKHLPDGFCQALRRLRYQAFGEFHSVCSKQRGKDMNFFGIALRQEIFQNRNQNLSKSIILSLWSSEKRF